ncbi:VOC family protein [Coraliomargarita parva]|uniref:VOC family protein n=1 Tax=Coraliomargarita parva TaxID=3014050 RepID=UPI0022B3FB48|nr:VOC family protein [Coraliomargarita parva]
MPITFDHTRIRVSNLEKSIDWYCKTCGFEVLKRTDKSPSGNQLAHLQIPGSSHKLELTYSPDYEVKFPEDLVHTCIRVDDIIEYCDMLEGLDLKIDLWPENWREKFVDGNKMAFITDPDGYEVEILEHSY